MTTVPQGRSRLDELGAALLAATTYDLARSEPDVSRAAAGASRRRPRRRTVAIALAATAVVLPGAAFAASTLISEGEVASGLPNAIAVLAGSNPTCKTVRANLEYDCELANPPKEGDIAAGAWKGALEPIVDATHRVSGGCRSLDDAGTRWRCYIGQEAVRQKIIGPTFLGEPLTSPVRG